MKRLLLRRSTIIMAILVAVVFLLVKCSQDEGKAGDTFAEFAGSDKCISCHKDVYDSHIRTAHFLTSTPDIEKYTKGSFLHGKNIYAYNPELYIRMEKRGAQYFQVVYFRGEEKKAIAFDMIIGSGTKGQSFAYWQENKLFQMPLTYFTQADRWSNSPGFPSKVLMDRPITSRCMECHATFAHKLSAGETKEEFDRKQIIYGVDCEKCHGAAAGHVEFHAKNPNEKQGKYIVNPASFTRQQSLDLCALCHGGQIQRTKPPFSFASGGKLSDYFTIDTVKAVDADLENFDVHGNQYGLLRASKCFKESVTLTCNSCHNTHKNERGEAEVFSQRCMSCHNTDHNTFCKIDTASVVNIRSNCIDCHMPVKPSRSIALFLGGVDIPVAAQIRSHFISINSEATKQFLDRKKK